MKTGDNRAAAEDGLPKRLKARDRCGTPASGSVPDRQTPAHIKKTNPLLK